MREFEGQVGRGQTCGALETHSKEFVFENYGKLSKFLKQVLEGGKVS